MKSNKIKTIAEIGVNHNASMEIAKKLIDAAKFAGFDYVKFQKRTPYKCVPERQKNIMRATPWGEMKYIDYKEKMEFGIDEYRELDNYCMDNNIDWFASVWDIDSAKFMTKFCNIVKIPSALITSPGLIEYCRDNFETVIMSTGMSTEKEILNAVGICKPDVIMHCCAAYPAKSEDLNLKYISHLQRKHDCEVGYSGHEEGLTTSFVACGMGISWIERHITLDHSMWGSDQRASIEPPGMIKFIKGIREIEKALGSTGNRTVLMCEKEKRNSLRK